MSIYLGGDREDNNNYSSNEWGKKKLEAYLAGEKNVKKGIVIPLEFDQDYYLSKREKFGVYSPDYWEWTRFMSYSSAVFSFYRQVAMQFYKKFPPLNEKSVPDFINLNLKEQNIDQLAQKLEDAEAGLLSQYSSLKTNRKIRAKFNEHAPLRRVRDAATRAWIMYYALKYNLHVQDAIKFKESYSRLNLADDVGVVKAYRGSVVIQHYLKRALQSKQISKIFGSNNDIYYDAESLKVFDEILTSVNGFSTENFKTIKESVQGELKTLKLDGNLAEIIEIYENFDNIYALVDKIYDLSKKWYNMPSMHRDIFENDWGEDLILSAKGIKQTLTNLTNANIDELFVKDFKKLIASIDAVLDYSSAAYIESKNL